MRLRIGSVWLGAGALGAVLGLSACGSDDSGGGGGSGASAGTGNGGSGNGGSGNGGSSASGGSGASGGAGANGGSAGQGGSSGNAGSSGNGGSSGNAGSSGSGGSGGASPPDPTCDGPRPTDTANASRVVGTGTPESCTEAALRTEIAAGGVIDFDCGSAPHTITLTQTLQVTKNVVLDGGGLITLSGGGSVRIMSLDTGNFEATSPTLEVQNLTFRDGHSSGTAIPLGTDTDGGGGAIYHLGGNVRVFNSRFYDNVCPVDGPDVAGGAIYGIGAGETTIVGSVFQGNRCSNGGAIGGLGTAIEVLNSTLQDNVATGQGANSVENGQQVGRGGNGGGICMDGRGRTLHVCGTIIKGNEGGAFGGAVFRTSYESEPSDFEFVTIDGNSIRDIPNEPNGAGGLYLQGTFVTIDSSTISRNVAGYAVGVWVNEHGAQAPGRLNMTNSTVYGNRVYERSDFTMMGLAAGINIGSGADGTITNCTIVGNIAQFASGIGRASPLTILNTVIHNEARNQYTPLNCTGSSYASPPGSGSHNVQWPNGPKDDMDCVSGITRADPMIGTLGDNGGPTETALPQTGSPLLTKSGTGCPALDQRGEPRSEPCTLGAVEVP